MSEKVAVVMAGGRGTRFWPRSRGHRPKQFLEMVGEGTLLHQTVARLGSDFPPERVYVVTTADLAEEACRLLPQ
ncbi:MAG: NTP transferase domain-containing protein, partial [Firmicutes bacterium]|nr:NTP transferase domain-containing protein [Bacillota bacterium]